jgi:hypothetical protein
MRKTFKFQAGMASRAIETRMDQVFWLVKHWGGECAVTLSDPSRSLEQNSRLWAILADVSRQVDWLVDGELRKITPEDWKAIFTAALQGHNRMARGLDGGVVMLGTSTSRMTVKAMKDLQDLISAFGDEREVKWSDYAEDGW